MLLFSFCYLRKKFLLVQHYNQIVVVVIVFSARKYMFMRILKNWKTHSCTQQFRARLRGLANGRNTSELSHRKILEIHPSTSFAMCLYISGAIFIIRLNAIHFNFHLKMAVYSLSIDWYN